MSTRSLYVYYRIRPDQADDARAAAQALLERVARSTGVQGRLLVKCAEPLLWMEVYEPVEHSDEFQAGLARHADGLQFDAFLLKGTRRNVECFTAVPCV